MNRACSALFTSFAPGDEAGRDGWELALSRPVRTLVARTLSQVRPVLNQAQAAAATGAHVAFLLSYEAAPALDACLPTRPAEKGFPLALVQVYNQPDTRSSKEILARYAGHPARLDPMRPLVSHAHYLERVACVRELIRRGECYQVNYTVPYQGTFAGAPLSLFARLGKSQGAGFSVFLDLPDHWVLCFSPELFFRRTGSSVTTRPMKGTAPRGTTLAEDEALASALAACPKNRAENVMIVDLLRNDLGKLALPGSVQVDALFQVERDATVHQLTSTVTARLSPGAGLPELLGALFPCGSVTGAPKRRAMQVIREQEATSRGVYCGAVGYLTPEGGCVANVPIRTLTIEKETGRARFNVGGGIVHDSSPEGEAAECEVKMRFLREETGPCG